MKIPVPYCGFLCYNARIESYFFHLQKNQFTEEQKNGFVITGTRSQR